MPPRCASALIPIGSEFFRDGDPVNAQELCSKLKGVIAFPITPFAPDLSLDICGLRKNLRNPVPHPVAAVVAAGGTGEMYSLTADEHARVVKATVEEVAGTFPVIAGVGFNHAIGSAMARGSERAGADALLALPPYYPNADEEALADYYAAIAGATPLPVFVYSRDWVNPSAAWIERLAARIPNLAGWKDDRAPRKRLRGHSRYTRGPHVRLRDPTLRVSRTTQRL